MQAALSHPRSPAGQPWRSPWSFTGTWLRCSGPLARGRVQAPATAGRPFPQPVSCSQDSAPRRRPPQAAGPPRLPAPGPQQQQQQPAVLRRASSTSGRPATAGAPQQQRQQVVRAADVKVQTSRAGVWELLRGQPLASVPVQTLSAALDHLVKVGKRPRPADLAAVRSVLAMGTERLALDVVALGLDPKRYAFGPWELTSYVRCAAAFKGLLTPAGLKAWQRALAQPGMVQGCSVQNAGNSLLSWGTLAASDPRLAVAVDKRLAAQLLQHMVSLAAHPADFPVRHACEALYGAALLDLRPSAAQAAALFGVAQQYVASLHYKDLTQLLLACDKLTAGGKSSESLPPSEDPYRIYYPGNELMATLLEHARQLGPQLSEQAAAQIVGACGGLGYCPHEAAWRELLAVLASRKGALKHLHVTAILVGCAELGEHPGLDVHQACWSVVEQEGHSNPWAVANAAWALAVLEGCSPAVWATLTELLAGHPSPGDVGLCQWYQAYLLMEEQHRRMGKGGCVACPPGLLQRSRAAWGAMHEKHSCKQPARFQTALALVMHQLAGAGQVVVEHPVRSPGGEGPLLVDVAVPGLRLALEADGPRHFLRNAPGKTTGHTLARDRLLRGWGWEVVSVPHTVYDAMWVGGREPPFEELVVRLRRHLEREHPNLVARIKHDMVGAAGAE